jgi:serine phosphatase RsbU (regulator of sigma subunit)
MVYYTNLPYGRYTFRVSACNNDGIWQDSFASVSVNIPAPIWQQPWFYALIGVFTAAGIVLYIRNRENSLRRTKQMLEALVAEKTEQIRLEKEKVEAQHLALLGSNRQVVEQKAALEKANEQVTDSIRYARRIQDAMLPSAANLQAVFPDAFLLYQPRNIVSGDFFWLKQIGQHHQLVVADCTGHGVPGAFMTVMGINFLNEIAHSEAKLPHEMLEALDAKIIETLNRSERSVQDGMDISVLHFDTEQKMVHFSGAKNPAYFVREGTLHTLEPNRSAIGGNALKERNKGFATESIALQPGDVFYLFSDGFQDQFGGPKDRKFMVKQFRQLLLSVSGLPMQEQRAVLLSTFEQWKEGYAQTDDVLVLGIRWNG